MRNKSPYFWSTKSHRMSMSFDCVWESLPSAMGVEEHDKKNEVSILARVNNDFHMQLHLAFDSCQTESLYPLGKLLLVSS